MSTCHASSGRVVRKPTIGFFGWMRGRGRRHPRSRTSFAQVEGAAKTRPKRCARMASRLVGTCRYSGDVTMSLMADTSLAVNWFGTLLGQLATSAGWQSASGWIQEW